MPIKLEVAKVAPIKVARPPVFRSEGYLTDGDLIKYFIDTPLAEPDNGPYFYVKEIQDLLGITYGTCKDRLNPWTKVKTLYLDTDEEEVPEVDIPQLLVRREYTVPDSKPVETTYIYAFVNYDDDESLTHIDDEAVLKQIIDYLNAPRLSVKAIKKLKAAQARAGPDPMGGEVEGPPADEEPVAPPQHNLPSKRGRKKPSAK